VGETERPKVCANRKVWGGGGGGGGVVTQQRDTPVLPARSFWKGGVWGKVLEGITKGTKRKWKRKEKTGRIQSLEYSWSLACPWGETHWRVKTIPRNSYRPLLPKIEMEKGKNPRLETRKDRHLEKRKNPGKGADVKRNTIKKVGKKHRIIKRHGV